MIYNGDGTYSKYGKKGNSMVHSFDTGGYHSYCRYYKELREQYPYRHYRLVQEQVLTDYREGSKGLRDLFRKWVTKEENNLN